MIQTIQKLSHCPFHRPHQPLSKHGKNKITGILGIKKEPNGSDVKNIK